MWTISKEFHFSASHMLKGLEEGHPCGNLHGHNYVLRLILVGKPNEDGFVLDYRKLAFVKEFVDSKLDHKHLNDVFEFQTSVENMSKYLYDLFKPTIPQLYGVEMSETPKTKCLYSPFIAVNQQW